MLHRFILTATVLGSLLPDAPGEPLSFNRDIRPILSNHCFACHGFDQHERKAGLRLDSEEGAKEEAIVAGNAEESPLWHRIHASDPDDVMPPPSTGKPLSEAQKETLKQWIDQGAPWEDHWAYVPPQRDPQKGLDDFVETPLKAMGLSLAPPTDRRTLARRLSFDLTGLPPTPAQVEAFIADTTPEAYDRFVDTLLASPRFGERLAIYWLDLVRFADTSGYHGDQHRDVALYRNYVIEAFNNNLPFDQFTIEQLGGDLLQNPTTDQRIASGYNRLLQTTEEGGSQPKEYRAKYAADRVRNVSSVWLGSTLACAECHDHKFDPFTQKDFYSLAAFFSDIEEPAVGRNQANLRLPSPAQETQLAELNEKVNALKKQLEAAKQTEDKEAQKDTQDALRDAEKARNAVEAKVPKTLVVKVRPEPLMTRVLPRGNWLDDSGPVVQPNIPEHLGALDHDASAARASRLDLAQWIVKPDNPLTARVFVNRVWKLLFGEAIARTVEDIGAQGEWPTHPELLDWLAIEFVESGWNVKDLFRTIVRSRTYQQASLESPALRQQDPYNRLLARQGRFRLDAEMIRDNALAISGLLVHTEEGSSTKPYQPAGYWSQLNFPKRTYQHDNGADQYRRGVYTYWCRTFLHPSMAAFDAPTREECTAERVRSNTPLQALVLLNDPTYVEASRVFGERIATQAGDDVQLGIRWAFRQMLTRPPSTAEETILTNLYRQQRQRFERDADDATALLGVGLAPVNGSLPKAQLAAWTSVSRALFNLHETITRY